MDLQHMGSGAGVHMIHIGDFAITLPSIRHLIAEEEMEEAGAGWGADRHCILPTAAIAVVRAVAIARDEGENEEEGIIRDPDRHLDLHTRGSSLPQQSIFLM
jgi:hypothetical protein